MKQEKENKICKAKKRPEPDGFWPLKNIGRINYFSFNS